MDFGSLKEQIANISLYDVKAAVRKAQNGIMMHPQFPCLHSYWAQTALTEE